MLSMPDVMTRSPDSSYILTDRHDIADSATSGDDMVSGLKTISWAMAHLPRGGTATIDLVRALNGSHYRAWWVDPKVGCREPIDRGAEMAVDGQRSFTSPSSGSIKNDWVLLLETVNTVQ